jgi:Tol biopolymer transport system component
VISWTVGMTLRQGRDRVKPTAPRYDASSTMTLVAGTRLGAYEITAKLGEGGMGEVYRASDTRLEREVAIKVLPAAFTADPERLARFEREARLLAQLHHPNIASIFGLEESGGVRALVMELVEGPTLAEWLETGALPLDESLSVARQIAEALEEAHEKGIVHRDLKPQNVKLSREGRVKVLDFGLAKALDAPGLAADVARSPTLMNSPTLTAAHGTQLGTVLGTAAYMAPEQAAGKPTDRRADVWSFGVLLYEMLTGKQLFAGDSVAETLAGVLKSEIDWTALPADTPPAIRRLLRRCLERQPRNRLHDIADARIVLDEVASGTADEAAAATVAPAPASPLWRRPLRPLPWLVALLTLLGFAFGAAAMRRLDRLDRRADVPSRTTRFFVTPPAPGEIEGYPALSPDGRSLAFCFAPKHSVPRLWLHSFDSGQSRELAGTEHAEQPFWSPDGRHLGFFAAGQLRHLELATGHVESLVALSDSRGGTWSETGDIVFSPSCCAPLSRVAASGGTPRPLTTLDTGAGEGSHRYPWALPGGEAILFTIPDGKQPGIYWLSLATGKRVFLLPGAARAVYDPRGFLLWNRDGSVVARRFDARTATLSAETLLVAEHVGTDPEKTAQDLFAAAGEVVAVRASAPYQNELRWFDRRGDPGQIVSSIGNFYDPWLSADGTRVVVAKSALPNYFSSDVWIFDTSSRDRATRFSFTGGHTPIWSPDGTTIYFAAEPRGEHVIVARRADGSGGEKVLYRGPTAMWLDGCSREAFLVVEGTSKAGTYKLWLLPLEGGHEARPFQQALPGSQGHAAFSPDGRLLAYTSDESGLPQIYVQPVDGSPGRWQVTTDGGDLATWRADGKEIFYVGFDRVLRAVPVRSLSPFTVGDAQQLFSVSIPQLAITSQHSYYLPSADGQRFLINGTSRDASDPGMLVTVGWSPAGAGAKPP